MVTDITLDENWVTITGPTTTYDGLWTSAINVQDETKINNSGTSGIGPDAITVNSWFSNMPANSPISIMIISATEITLLTGVAVQVGDGTPPMITTPAIQGNMPVFATLNSLMEQVAALTARIAALEAK